MQVVEVTFEAVFDVVRHRFGDFSIADGKGDAATYFSFSANGKNEYGIAVPGYPRIESGMTVTAVFNKPGDWQTLVGWMDHATGDIVLPQPHKLGVAIVHSLFGACVFVILSVNTVGPGRWFSGFAGAVSVFAFGASIISWRKYKRVRHTLLELQRARSNALSDANAQRWST